VGASWNNELRWLGALLIGVLCGLIPIIAGVKRDKRELAAAGFIACVIGGQLLGIQLALPVGIISTLVILYLSKK
jgi:hypothetical protein